MWLLQDTWPIKNKQGKSLSDTLLIFSCCWTQALEHKLWIFAVQLLKIIIVIIIIIINKTKNTPPNQQHGNTKYWKCKTLHNFCTEFLLWSWITYLWKSCSWSNNKSNNRLSRIQKRSQQAHESIKNKMLLQVAFWGPALPGPARPRLHYTLPANRTGSTHMLENPLSAVPLETRKLSIVCYCQKVYVYLRYRVWLLRLQVWVYRLPT